MHHPASVPLRLSTANILTDLGWMAATFHVPVRQSLMDFLAPGVQVVKCTRVRVPNYQDRIPFVGLRRDAIFVIEPTQGDELVETAGSVGRTSEHEVGCLLPVGILRGTLEVLVNVRVSDYLRQQPGLVVLRDCQLTPFGEAAGSPPRKMRTVILNMGRVTGMAEWESKAV